MKTISGEVSSIFPELNCFEINSDIFFHGVKASTFSRLRLGKKITLRYRTKKIKSGDWTFTDFIFLKFQKNNNINKTNKMKKEYNARGEKNYENAIKRENAKKEKIKQNKQDEKHKREYRGIQGR